MNVPAAIELAFAEIIQSNATLIEGTIVKAWQSLIDSPDIDTDGTRDFPLVDIRSNTPGRDENQHTRYCDVAIMCATYNDEDRQHSDIRELYEAAQNVCDQLHDQFYDTGAVYTAFEASLTAALGASFTLGGVSYTGGAAPVEESGVNALVITMRIHYHNTTS